MSRDTNANLLKRWMAIDLRLANGSMRVAEVAEVWMVNRKTIRRDLALFRQLGYRPEPVARKPGVNYVWRYPAGQAPMFTATGNDTAPPPG
jgi:hypothetical protein